uniref:HSF-type DNA-binding domain-containing protein n=1 Tax=Electrophorus electricus TaxID=8005 RepID=A0A4W4DNC7_ELEEL
MEIDEALLTLPINPNNFPAKLWRLVNDPLNRSIRWDSYGDGIIIDQHMFEADLLTPTNKQLGESPDLFKTTNFTSFIRQLNLYGFRKMMQVAANMDKQSDDDPVTDGVQHRFHNPNFKQGRPELLVNLKRLTSSNKAKLEAGLEVNCRPQNRFRRFLLNSPEENSAADIKALRGCPRESASPYQYHSDASQPLKEYDPTPSTAWITTPGEDSSPTAFYTDRGIPVSVIRRFPTDSSYTFQSSPGNGLPQHGSQNMYTFFFSPSNECVTASYYHYGYYPTYSVGCLHPSGPNPDLQAGDRIEPKKSDVNLDTVFKIVDELQGSPKVHFAKVATPEKHLSGPTTESRPPASSLYNPAGSAFKPVSSLASSPHGFPHPSSARPSSIDPQFSPIPMEGTFIAVQGQVPSGITIAVRSRGSEQRPGQVKAVPVKPYEKVGNSLDP